MNSMAIGGFVASHRGCIVNTQSDISPIIFASYSDNVEYSINSIRPTKERTDIILSDKPIRLYVKSVMNHPRRVIEFRIVESFPEYC